MIFFSPLLPADYRLPEASHPVALMLVDFISPSNFFEMSCVHMEASLSYQIYAVPLTNHCLTFPTCEGISLNWISQYNARPFHL